MRPVGRPRKPGHRNRWEAQLRRIMDRRGLDAEAVRKRTGMSRSTVQKWLAGVARPAALKLTMEVLDK